MNTVFVGKILEGFINWLDIGDLSPFLLVLLLKGKNKNHLWILWSSWSEKDCFLLSRGLKLVLCLLEYLWLRRQYFVMLCWKMQRHSQFMRLDLNTRSTDGCVFANMRDLVSGDGSSLQRRNTDVTISFPARDGLLWDGSRKNSRSWFFYPSSEIEMFDV